MENHVSGLTLLVNHYLGHFALALLSLLHIQPNNLEVPIPEHVVMALVVLVLATVLALWLRSRLSVEKPGAAQQLAEFLLRNPLGVGISDILEENSGHEWQRYVPMVGSVAIFVLFSNLLGVFPVFTSPTAVVTVPFAGAIVTFLYFNWHGIRHHGGWGYLKSFTGGLHWVLGIPIFVVEIISTTARLLSLTVRLWANIFASDIIYGLFLSLFAGLAAWGWEKSPVLGVIFGIFPAIIPLAFIVLHVLVSVIQAYVFTILPAVYVGMATADEH